MENAFDAMDLEKTGYITMEQVDSSRPFSSSLPFIVSYTMCNSIILVLPEDGLHDGSLAFYPIFLITQPVFYFIIVLVHNNNQPKLLSHHLKIDESSKS